MKSKAAQTIREARVLAEKSAWCGSASRAYYSLFQALIPLLNAGSTSPRQLDRKYQDRDNPNRWTHAGMKYVLQRGLVQVPVSHSVFATAKAMRRKADYTPVAVREPELMTIIVKIEAALTKMGVTP